MTAVVYAPSLTGGWLYEDHMTLWQAGPVRGLSGMVARAVGFDALGQRLTSLGWHILNGGLLWLLARQILAPIAAGFAVVIFLWHPLQTESVAYIAGRPELITATWMLLALIAVERGWLWAAWGAAALAVTGKEMGITAWVLVPWWAWIRGQSWSTRACAVWGASAGASVVAVWAVLRWVHHIDLATGWQLAALWAEAGRLLLLLPESLAHPSALTLDHAWIDMTKPIAAVGIIGWGVALALSHRYWRWGGLALVGTILAAWPRLLFPLWDGWHERYLYTPMIVWSLALGSLLTRKERDGSSV